MKFTKMHGAGNDFIVIDNRDEWLSEAQMPRLAKKLCTHRLSIGADGMMVVQNPTVPDADYRMLFFNADGSMGEMCGNGARCICRYGYEKKLAGEIQHVQTTAGLVTGTRIDKREYQVRLNDVTTMKLHMTLETSRGPVEVHYIELGNPGLPHAVVHMPGLKDTNPDALREFGRELRYHPAFPKGANVNFYDFIGEDALTELTFERGVEDFTLACGTGTGSVVSVLTVLEQVSGKDVKITVPGGLLRVSVDASGKLPVNLLLTGPTNMVAEGEVLDEDLEPELAALL